MGPYKKQSQLNPAC